MVDFEGLGEQASGSRPLSAMRFYHVLNRSLHLVELGRLIPNLNVPVIMENITKVHKIELNLHSLYSLCEKSEA
jgi:hypothetical protein